MLDSRVNTILHPAMNSLVNYIPRQISANTITLFGFVIGLMAVPLLWFKLYSAALAVILINRFLTDLMVQLLAKTESQI